MKKARARQLRPTRQIDITREPDFRGPIVSDESLFVVDRTHLTRLDRRSLKKVWRVEVEKDSGPVLVDAPLLLLARGRGEVYAVSMEDGRRVWGPTPMGYCVRWHNKVLSLKPLAVLDTATGMPEGVLPFSGDVRGDTSLCGNVIVGKDGSSPDGDPLVAFNLVEKQLLWERNVIAETTARAGKYEASRMVSGGQRTLLIGRPDWRFACSVVDGSIRWDRPVRVLYYSSNVAENHVCLLAGGRGESFHLLCLDIETGETIYDVEQPLVQPSDRPFHGTIDGPHIGFGTNGGLVVVFSLEDGMPQWWSRYHASVLPPCFVDGRVLVPAFDGKLLVFEPSRF